MDIGPIPIVIAVSGHRDLIEEDILPIKEAIQNTFSLLRQKYPSTKLQLLSGLAEGADSIAAEAALSSGLELIAVLPMPQHEYVQDFTSEISLLKFKSLLNAASEIRISPSIGISRESHYEGLGLYMVKHAQCLYAIWDGNEQNPNPGGTADVVRMCRNGVITSDEVLALPEISLVQHLRCCRMKNPKAYPDKLRNTWTTTDNLAQKRIDSIFKAIDDFNLSALAIQNKVPADITKSKTWLIGETTPPKNLEIPIELFSIADALAGNRQKQRDKSLWLISALAFFSIFFQQVHLGPDMQWYWLVMHITLGIIAFGLYRYMFSGNESREDQYLDWRALAEGFRVQVFWQASGINKCVSDYYLNSQRDEIDWIRQAIRNTCSLVSIPAQHENIEFIKEHWLKDQLSFFSTGKSSSLKKLLAHEKWERISKSLFALGIVATAALLSSTFFKAPSAVNAWLSLLPAIAFLAAGITRNYSNQMAFQEHAKRYGKIRTLFEIALKKLESGSMKMEHEQAEKLIKAIGKEALSENAEWLLIHRQRKFEIPT